MCDSPQIHARINTIYASFRNNGATALLAKFRDRFRNFLNVDMSSRLGEASSNFPREAREEWPQVGARTRHRGRPRAKHAGEHHTLATLLGDIVEPLRKPRSDDTPSAAASHLGGVGQREPATKRTTNVSFSGKQ